ncbi:hypothetical protein [Bradyrhizobium sp. 62B]|uniref:hypothetical protein n=1 Tax=Bradyrhizobium sp. 62B TaxID=2898442 RepID=UPI0025580DF6
MMVEQTLNDIARLERDGFVMLDGVLPAKQVERARQELAALFEQDVTSRSAHGLTEAYRSNGPIGATILTKPSHLALDVDNRNAHAPSREKRCDSLELL